MNVLISIALRHLWARRRQSLVSLSGIVIGTAFFLAISSLMQGSQNDFIKRMVDNSPHITISDEFRTSTFQPAERLNPDAMVEVRGVKPQSETRGIRGYKKILEEIRTIPGVRAAAVLSGQAILNYAGQDTSLVLNGMIPSEIEGITTIDDYMTEGSVKSLISDRGGIIVGAELVRQFSLRLNDNITLVSSTGQVRVFKIVGIFRTGRSNYDFSQSFLDLKRVQAMMNRPDRANTMIIKLDNPQVARAVSKTIEAKIRYKSVSWQEATEDLMSTLAIRNMIMYSVVSAVLIVAAFGIYNIISTVVIEKHRDIAILKSMGFHASDIRSIFLAQGMILGIAGVAFGIPMGCGLMLGLMQIKFKPPGGSVIYMPIDWGAAQFLIAASFALGASVLAAWLPARKAAKILPVDILRGGT